MCGCGPKVLTDSPTLTRAAMCAFCVGDSKECRPGLPVTLTITAHSPCRKGWHPSAGGLVRFLGINWRGVPWPVRVWLWATRANHREASAFVASLPGCGCVDRLRGLV